MRAVHLSVFIQSTLREPIDLSLPLSLSLYYSLLSSIKRDEWILFQFNSKSSKRERERAREGDGAIHLPAAAPS